MGYISEIKNVLADFEVHTVRYALLRNYEFLFDSAAEPGFDLDLVVAEGDFARARELLLKHLFVEYPRQFSLVHRGFGKYFAEEKVKFGFDIQVGGVHWNDMAYLSADKVIEHRVKKDGFYVLSDEDAFIMYACHSLLGKRKFKEKYKQELVRLGKNNLDFKHVYENLSQNFNKKIAKDILKKVKAGNFSSLEKKSLWYVAYFVLHKPENILTFTKLFFRWLKWLRLGKSYPLISFIGPDGSGKSTAAEHMVEVLKQNRRKALLVYMGRGKRNILPIKTIAGKYKKHEQKEEKTTELKKQSTFKQKIIYSAAAPLYTLDLLLRYLITVFPQRQQKKIIVTDRYCSDILLMQHVPFCFKQFLLRLFPKPSLTFYLHNDAQTLYQRRRQQSPAELERQMKLFDYLSRKLNAVPVKTISFEQDSALIEGKIFEYFMKNRF